MVFVLAGNWQRGRMHDRAALGAQFEAARGSAPVALPLDLGDRVGWRYRTVEAAGRYDAERQILLDNRVHGGRAGYHVVTPLVTGDGRAVLVNRGFIKAGATRAALPEAPPPAGEVRIRGRLNQPPSAYLELGATAPERGVWQNLDLARFTAATGLAVLPLIIEQVGGPADGLVRDWPRPDAGSDRNRIYMMQWYAFAGLAAGLWSWQTVRARRLRR